MPKRFNPVDEPIKEKLIPITDTICDKFGSYRPYRIVAFDKSDSKNWCVPRHQDKVIALQEFKDNLEYNIRS